MFYANQQSERLYTCLKGKNSPVTSIPPISRNPHPSSEAPQANPLGRRKEAAGKENRSTAFPVLNLEFQ
jgi:hypothetical protein